MLMVGLSHMAYLPSKVYLLHASRDGSGLPLADGSAGTIPDFCCTFRTLPGRANCLVRNELLQCAYGDACESSTTSLRLCSTYPLDSVPRYHSQHAAPARLIEASQMPGCALCHMGQHKGQRYVETLLNEALPMLRSGISGGQAGGSAAGMPGWRRRRRTVPGV